MLFTLFIDALGQPWLWSAESESYFNGCTWEKRTLIGEYTEEKMDVETFVRRFFP